MIESLTLNHEQILIFLEVFQCPHMEETHCYSDTPELNATTFRQSTAKYLFDGGSCLTILTWLAGD